MIDVELFTNDKASRSIVCERVFVTPIDKTDWKRKLAFSQKMKISEVMFFPTRRIELEIVGVVQDFNFASLHEPIRPVLFTLTGQFTRNVSVKTVAGRLHEARDHVEQIWHQQFSGQALSLSFLDEEGLRRRPHLLA